MIKSAMITECWTPQSSHRDTFFSIYLVTIIMILKIFVGDSNQALMVEESVVDASAKTFVTYTRNKAHTY